MLTPTCLITNQKNELITLSLNHYYNASHYLLQVGTHSFSRQESTGDFLFWKNKEKRWDRKRHSMKTAGSRGTNNRGGLEGGWASGSFSVVPCQPVSGQGQGHQQQLTRQGQSFPAWSSGALRTAAWVSTTQPPSSRPSLFWTRTPLTPNWDVETNPGSQILVA